MPGVTYTMTPKAEAELIEWRNTLMASRRAGLLTSDQVRDEYLAKFDQLTAGASLQAYDENAPIGVHCEDCYTTHIMPRETLHYRCKCSPYIDRSTLNNRVVLY